MNIIACGDCKKFHVRTGGGGTTKSPTVKELSRGFCLAQTIFSSKKAGQPVFPPGARVEDLPDGQHKVTLVKKTDVVKNCTNAVRKN
jgi:hypothetical protein